MSLGPRIHTVQQLYETRLLKGAVNEAQHYPRMLCNQRCKTHIFIKNGIPYDQSTGLKHDCIMTRIAKMFYGHYNMIQIPRVREAQLALLEVVLTRQEEYNRKWNIAFDKWKKTGKVPMSYEVDNY